MIGLGKYRHMDLGRPIASQETKTHANCQTQIFEDNTCTVSKNFGSTWKAYEKIMLDIPPLTTGGVAASKSEDKADILNCWFYSVFTDEDLLSIPSRFLSCQISP